MQYPYLETEFNDNLDKQVVKIINQYWKIENRTFLYSPTKLRNKYKITQPKLNSIVKNNSKTKLFLDECVECKKPIIIPVTSQSTAKDKIENPYFHCSDCRSKLNRAPSKDEFTSFKNHRLKYAIKARSWNKLTREELAVLKKVIEYDDYRSLQKKVIQTNFEHYWPIIEKLDRLSLIEIQRDPLHNRIQTIFFLPELANELEINRRKIVFTESSLNFHVPQRLNKTEETQPDYSKPIKFDRDIVLKKGTEYLCSIWTNPDGSLNFGLKSIDELKAQKDSTKGSDPKAIGEVIKEIWK